MFNKAFLAAVIVAVIAALQSFAGSPVIPAEWVPLLLLAVSLLEAFLGFLQSKKVVSLNAQLAQAVQKAAKVPYQK